MKKSLFWAIAIAIAMGLVITSASSLPVSKSTGETNDLTVKVSDKVAQKISVPTSYLETPLIELDGLPIIGEPAFAEAGHQLHPAFGKAGGIHMASYRDEDLGAMIWTYSTSDGPPYEPGIYYEISGDYPSIKLWEGERFFGTFVTDYLDLDGGPSYLYEINDATQLEDNVLNPLTYWDWSSYGWSDMIDADIACDSSQQTFEWGVSSYVTSTTYGDGYTDGPTIVYSDEDDEGQGWISWYYYNDCDHCDVDIDRSIIYSYAVYDWEDTTAGYYKILCRVNDFDAIEAGYDQMFELDTGSNLQYPAVAAGDGNIVILAETDENGNKDIICLYGSDLNSMSTTFVVDTGDDEMFPEVRHVGGARFIATYVKNGNLYAAETTNGGATWTESRWQVNDNDGCVVAEYKTADLCENAAKAMWEEDCGADVDIYIANVLPNDPPGAPDIDGPAGGKPETSYDFDFTAIDPDGDDVKFIITWGDGESETTGFTASGTPITASHSWLEKGEYTITAKAQDSNGAEGSTASHNVNIPRSKNVVFESWFLRILEQFPNTFKILRNLLGL